MRVDPPTIADERQMLDAWLEYHRETLLVKCEGLDAAGLAARPVGTSLLSLHGLVRHMAEVERHWFRRVLSGERAAPIWWTESDPDGDLELGADADFERDVGAWRSEVAVARSAAAERELDAVGAHPRDGTQVSLRWIYVHMIEEYARHNGHADLIREMVDGTVGD